MVTSLTMFTSKSCGVELTLETFTRVAVTGPRHAGVDVVVTDTHLTTATRGLRGAVIVVDTFVTVGT